MKKFFSFVFVCVAAVSLFADSGDTIDGAIAVADKGDMPTGLFGKTAGYLPGDTVSIMNPATGATLQILNLGTLDSSDGVALLLSPESAARLGVTKGSDTQVRLSPRSGYFDETVSGSAVISKGGDAPSKTAAANSIARAAPSETPATPAIEEKPEIEEEPAIEEIPAIAEEPAVEELPAPEEELAELDDDYLDAKAAVEKESPLAALEAEGEDGAAAEGAPSEELASDAPYVEEPEELAADIPYDEEPVAEAGSPSGEEPEETEELASLDGDEGAEEELFVDEELEPAARVVYVPLEEEKVKDEKAEEPPAETVAEESYKDDELAPVEEIAAEADSDSEEPVASMDDEPEQEELASLDDGDGNEAEDSSLTLVPAGPNSPAANSEGEIADTEPELVPVESEEIAAEPPAPEKAEAAPLPVSVPEVSKSVSDFIVDSEHDLQNNCFYVQVATLGDMKNIEKTIGSYSKYPLVLVPNKKGAYKLLVGPLNIDEYGAVLAKFKAYGYKDAFVKAR